MHIYIYSNYREPFHLLGCSLPYLLASTVSVSKSRHSPCACVRARVSVRTFLRMRMCTALVVKVGSDPQGAGVRDEERDTEGGTDNVKPPLLVTLQGPLGPSEEPSEKPLRTVCGGVQRRMYFSLRHPALIVKHSLLDLLLNGPEAKLSGCTDVNYSRLLLISCVSYSFWNRDRKPQLVWSLKTIPRAFPKPGWWPLPQVSPPS